MVLLERGDNHLVKMLRHGAAIAIRNDLYALQMVK